ncbi:AAA family ATPase [Pseudohalioglobus sediminis]|uniref:AAA family ATPase n=1 Tax=Pseudohalioglobus sediminis TaxID=2606449 RepID=A0A5B0X449_9GAMM|nr:AAA family ATPase [Pseudohalioglobus sediminis]KAA1194043.1 AAA family ATPase [Pseudohalioglobus sediminis]
MHTQQIQRRPAEEYYADELARLRSEDTWPKPPGWLLSPRAVETFVLGDPARNIAPKFVAPSEIVTRVIVSLATQRGAMLVGEPGTAKSWLSELICAAICDNSTLIIQGGAIETVTQLLYTWNSAILERKGPCKEALIPGPIYRGMEQGLLVRYEEIARSAPALQDALLSIMSERAITVPELAGDDGILYARDGFNLVATSNTTDLGVNDMSSALKRRMNFETIRPIKAVDDEIGVVMREAEKALRASGVDVKPDEDIVRALVVIFHELRNGQSLDGRSTDRLASAVMSTAEAVSVAHAMGVYAYYYRDGSMLAEDFNDFLVGTAIKDDIADLKRMNHYFETEVALKEGPVWKTIYERWQAGFRY